MEGTLGAEPGESGFKSPLWCLSKSDISSSSVCLECNTCVFRKTVQVIELTVIEMAETNKSISLPPPITRSLAVSGLVVQLRASFSVSLGFSPMPVTSQLYDGSCRYTHPVPFKVERKE